MAATDLVLETETPESYLAGNEFIDVEDQSVRAVARTLRKSADSDVAFARAAFEWVRDEVGHSFDVQDPRVTLAASEVVEQRVGLCYAKSHLLAALLRSEGVPAGLCYQRLVHGDGHVLHGLVAIYLDGVWCRQDPRGNKDGVDAQFSLASEQLAWRVDPDLGEVDYPRVFASPAPCVVEALSGASNVLSLYDTGLPTSL